MLKFILTLHTTSTAPHLMDSLVPLAQTTADINAMVQFKRENMSELRPEVSVPECLSLLHMTALGCVRDEADIRRFWRLMRFDFVLMMLNPNQPIEDIRLMLNILSTSVLNNSFGPFVGSLGEEQTTNERHVISRITGLLLDSPNAEEGKEPYDATEIAELNQDVLELLGAMCCTEYGGRILALHPNVIARLVKVMNDELESLYDFQDTHPLRYSTIPQKENPCNSPNNSPSQSPPNQHFNPSPSPPPNNLPHTHKPTHKAQQRPRRYAAQIPPRRHAAGFF
jgi:Protein of unknown function (DUF3636)